MSDRLIAAATEAQRNAYAPYSKYPVGAAVETSDGRVFAGCNVENASLGLTICAERVAVGAAVSAGARDIKSVVVVTNSVPPAAPCGACRQVLAEFGSEIAILAVGPGGSRKWKISELLPDSFGPRDLESKG
ncbi:MAG: cytidine deaminase [Gemmatimonadetes bacterium]|nr:cytidine deaminase [Gemmatimonadota bacterium]MCZ6760394.1 cytidine deaminase [Gemmatimonadota bacterium]